MNQAKLQDIGLLIMRLGLGLIVFYYGSQKMLGLFGGVGFSAQVDIFKSTYDAPPLLGTLAIFGEFFGSLGLIFGALTRLAALGVCATMSGAVFFAAHKAGIFNQMNHGDTSAAGKIFYPLTVAIFALGLAFLGGGAYSLDAKLFKGAKRGRRVTPK